MDRITRFELKYQFPPEYLTAFRRDLRSFLAEDPHNRTAGGNVGYQVRSLYFESVNFSCYEDKMMGASSRTKLRVRAYPPFEKKSAIVLEIKRKESDTVRKERTEITAGDVSDLICGKHAAVLRRYPNDFTVRNFIEEKISQGLHFSYTVDYHREAYVNPHNTRYVRVNLDKDLKFCASRCFLTDPLIGGHYYHGEHFVICEMKFEGTAPFWMPFLIRKYGLLLAPFSKFAEGVERSWNYVSQEFGAIRTAGRGMFSGGQGMKEMPPGRRGKE